MKNIVGVRFRKTGKIYFFDPNNLDIDKRQLVIVETTQGEEIGEVMIAKREMPNNKIVAPLKKVLRIANKKDEEHYKENKEKEKEAFKICQEKIKQHKLTMKLIEVEYKFDKSKILFYFSAEGRVDFRELVRDLASIFKTRIELRQIGVRDEVKRIGGNGICGRELCCCSFLGNFETVSIKMAKEQNISLTPSKISGNCGRLMCCLKYEEEVYADKIKKIPKIGAIVKTKDGTGEVCSVEILQERVKVKFIEGEDIFFRKYLVNDIKIIKNVEKKNMLSLPDEQEQRELEELEKLEIEDNKSKNEDEL